MFTIYFADAEPRTATRKPSAVKIAERDGALYVESPKGEVVWGEKPAEPIAPKTGERKPYNLNGATAAADEERAAAVALLAEKAEGVELVPAEEISEGDVIIGRRTRDARREVAEVRIGKKWITAWDAEGRAFVYAPVGSLVPRVVA